MARPTPLLYTGALLSAGAFGVHQLRYLLAYGDRADGALAEAGHGYLIVAEPLLGLLLAFAIAHLVRRVAHGPQRSRRMSRGRLGTLLAVALLAVFTGQEFIEMQLAGASAGVLDVFADGGWVALPLCAVIGGLLGLLARAVEVAGETGLVVGGASLPAGRQAVLVSVPRPRLDASLSSPLGRHLAGRAPPRCATS